VFCKEHATHLRHEVESITHLTYEFRRRRKIARRAAINEVFTPGAAASLLRRLATVSQLHSLVPRCSGGCFGFYSVCSNLVAQCRQGLSSVILSGPPRETTCCKIMYKAPTHTGSVVQVCAAKKAHLTHLWGFYLSCRAAFRK
jgi:hypothetical protein